MESFISTFHIDWKIIIAQVINFGVVFFSIYFLALKPLKKLMSERTEKIEKGLEDAKTNNNLLTQTKKEYDDVLSKARSEAHEIFQEGKREAENKKTEMLENTKIEVVKMIENGKKTLESEKNKMVEEAKAEIVSLVVKATEKLLESKPDDKFDQKSIDIINKM
jgi:F-type H+-transporting ATPase subunit b